MKIIIFGKPQVDIFEHEAGGVAALMLAGRSVKENATLT
jgi:hypothetical protein